MAKTKYIIELSDDERDVLNRIIEEENESERTIVRAKILLLSDVNSPQKLSVVKIADQLDTTHTTVQTVRTEYAKYGLQRALYRKLRTDKRKVTPEIETQIKALLSEQPPDGRARWTERLLCQICVERGIIEHIAVSVMHGVLKKIKKEQLSRKRAGPLSKETCFFI